MTSAVEIAACILNESENLSTMKLQKLLYYSQAYHLARNDEALFDEDFEAWANGPVIRDLFVLHKGRFIISAGFFGDAALNQLDKKTSATVSHVIDTLGKCDGAALSRLTHSEPPWLEARGTCGPSEWCNNIISKESIKDFYSSEKALANPVFAA